MPLIPPTLISSRMLRAPPTRQGTFSIEGLSAGGYFIRTGNSDSGPYPTEWYDDIPFEQGTCGATPDVVSVSRGGTVDDLDIELNTHTTEGVTVPTGPPPSDWLGVVNFYRSSSGLAPVIAEVPCWSDGIAAHLTYLSLTQPICCGPTRTQRILTVLITHLKVPWQVATAILRTRHLQTVTRLTLDGRSFPRHRASLSQPLVVSLRT